MDGKELRKRAVSRAHELPGTELTHPFGLDSEVWKICEKVFMFLAELGGEEIVNLKTDPLDSEILRKTHANITPGWHMNKKHWITIRAGGKVDAQLVDELVTDSYLLVVESLLKYKQLVNPQTFAADN